MGAVRVREGDPEEDREAVQDVLRRAHPEAAGDSRHEWLYLENPAGRARVWLAEDADSGDAVGTSAAHPRRLWCDGHEVTALVLSDFAVDESRRTLGPALQLQRATLACVTGEPFAFAYDFPSASMLAVYLRLGGFNVAEVPRWVRLLRVGPYLERRFGKRLLARVAGAAGDLAVRSRDLATGGSRGLDVDALEDACGEEFDELDAEARRDGEIRAVRSAAYVEWRYRQHVVTPHEVLCARDAGGRLRGYLAHRAEADGAVRVVADLFPGGDLRVARALLAALIRRARRAGAEALWTEAPAGSASAALLQQLRFAPRETLPGYVVAAPADGPVRSETLQNPAAWWILAGDRDV